MNEDRLHNYPVWDRLFELLYSRDENLTDQAVDAELTRIGIDMKPAFQRLHKMIETQRAKSQLALARAKRTSIGTSIQNVVAPRLEDLRKQVSDFVGKLKGDDAQLAYFHKLDKAASEEDLQSLLDDLEKLDAIRKLADDSES